MPLTKHVAAHGSTTSERLTASLARKRLISICACTELIGTGIGGVRFERGRTPRKMGRLRCWITHRITLENDGETSLEKTWDDEAQRSRKCADGQERQTAYATGCGYNRIGLDMSTFLGHDMWRACWKQRPSLILLFGGRIMYNAGTQEYHSNILVP